MQKEILDIMDHIKSELNNNSLSYFKTVTYVKEHSEENQKNWASELLLDQADLLALLHENNILNPYSLKIKGKIFINQQESFSVTLWNERKKTLKIYFSDLFTMVEELLFAPLTKNDAIIEALNLVKHIINLRMNLLHSFLPFVNYIAKSYTAKNQILFSDLQSEGYIGLINAIEIFYFVSPNIPFKVYVATHIKQAIRRFIFENRKGLRVPYLTAVHEKEEENDSINKSQSFYFSELSTPNFTYEEYIPSHSSLFSLIWNKSLRESLEKLLLKLSQKEQDIISMHYGLKNSEQYTLADIGKKLEISRERVRQIELDALNKLKKEGVKIFAIEDLFSEEF